MESSAQETATIEQPDAGVAEEKEDAFQWEGAFKNVRTFCAFVGHTRCGHSLVGALIDAHPNAAVPHQGKIFGEDDTAGELVFQKRQRLFRWIVNRAAGQAEQGRSGSRRTAEGDRLRYSYEVPDQWQGRFTELHVLGTKHAAEVSNALGANPKALDELNKLTKLPLKLISVVRNPWDNVGSLGVGVPPERRKVRRRVVESYLFRSRMIQRAKEGGYDVLDVFLDDLSANPHQELTRLCEYLGLEPLPDYIDACAGVVLDSPNQRRDEYQWLKGDIDRISAAISEFPWLERYREDPPPKVTRKAASQDDAKVEARLAEFEQRLLAAQGEALAAQLADLRTDLMGEMRAMFDAERERLGRAIEALGNGESSQVLSADEVAERVGRSRSWVYSHRAELGAVSLGDGPRSRVGFPSERVAAYLASAAGTDADDKAPSPKKSTKQQ